MPKLSKVLAAAALVGACAALAGVAAPFNGGARAVESMPASGIAGERIAAAFAVAPAEAAAPPLGAAKKDDLLVAAGCTGQKWPDIVPACLVTAHGAPARPVRNVAVGYQVGEATTVLVRMPAPQIASR
jgi:hypothetical protein